MTGRGDDGQGDWDSSNARALLQYTADNHQEWATRKNLAFELGNEKEFALSAAQTATSFLELRKILDATFAALSPVHRPMLVGPSTNIRTDWLTIFLNHLQTGGEAASQSDQSDQYARSGAILDVIAYHMYPGYGRSVHLPSLIMRPAWLDFTHSVADQVRASVLTSKSAVDLLDGTTELWIDETAAAWASGTAGICNGFLSGFWYLDQLASVATKGHSAMCRQCLVGGNYSLIEQRENAGGTNIPAWTPNPDWWTAWMWRSLVGGSSDEVTIVLAVNQVMPYEGDFVPEARMYLVCTPKTSPHYQQGSVTSIWLNQDLNSNKSLIMYQGSRFSLHRNGVAQQPEQRLGDSPAVPPSFANLPRFEYIMESSDGDLLSREMHVNGVLLSMSPSGNLPTFPIAEEAKVENMIVPPSSYGFAVYPNANASACL
jgi:heparanase 1